MCLQVRALAPVPVRVPVVRDLLELHISNLRIRLGGEVVRDSEGVESHVSGISVEVLGGREEGEGRALLGHAEGGGSSAWMDGEWRGGGNRAEGLQNGQKGHVNATH